jgi:hypothetical protein
VPLQAEGRWQARFVTAPRLLALLALVLALGAAGCGGGGGSSSTTTEAAAPTTTLPPRVSHAAPDLEALLPGSIDGVKLEKGSATGAGVFGGDAFSREMTRRLSAAGKAPADLRFANAQNPKTELEIGVFEVPGMSAADLRAAIVASSRPNAPGLLAEPATLGGKPVTTVVYPSGTVLYLYEHGDHVFYIGTQSKALAVRAIGLLP